MNFFALLAEVAHELGCGQLWKTLTTTLDEQLAAISEAGYTRQELPTALKEKLNRIETTLTDCYQQLRVLAARDTLAHFLLLHSRASNVSMTLAQRFEITGRLRRLAEQWKIEKPDFYNTACLWADSLESELYCYLYLDGESLDALTRQVYDLGGIVIPRTWQGWSFPRLKPPIPRAEKKTPAEIQARMAREDRKNEGWEQAIIDRICAPPYTELSFWFPQVVSEEELNLPENRVDGGFSKLFSAEEWPVIQLQMESPPVAVKRPDILSCTATTQAFRCNWEEADFTPELLTEFRDRLAVLRDIFVALHRWCQANLVELADSCFCAPKIWNGDPQFHQHWENA